MPSGVAAFCFVCSLGFPRGSFALDHDLFVDVLIPAAMT